LPAAQRVPDDLAAASHDDAGPHTLVDFEYGRTIRLKDWNLHGRRIVDRALVKASGLCPALTRLNDPLTHSFGWPRRDGSATLTSPIRAGLEGV
jgi:hypothetical protein